MMDVGCLVNDLLDQRQRNLLCCRIDVSQDKVWGSRWLDIKRNSSVVRPDAHPNDRKAVLQCRPEFLGDPWRLSRLWRIEEDDCVALAEAGVDYFLGIFSDAHVEQISKGPFRAGCPQAVKRCRQVLAVQTPVTQKQMHRLSYERGF